MNLLVYSGRISTRTTQSAFVFPSLPLMMALMAGTSFFRLLRVSASKFSCIKSKTSLTRRMACSLLILVLRICSNSAPSEIDPSSMPSIRRTAGWPTMGTSERNCLIIAKIPNKRNMVTTRLKIEEVEDDPLDVGATGGLSAGVAPSLSEVGIPGLGLGICGRLSSSSASEMRSSSPAIEPVIFVKSKERPWACCLRNARMAPMH
mmetsp:Transcript_6176/g.10313  ORF Transcript_6176/g.10313 Transcript_6176/m.10313 type:complete len:205 (-) Transcript_6176:468-1082(-)